MIDRELVIRKLVLVQRDLDLLELAVGALGWLPGVPRFFSVVASLLRLGGQFFLYDNETDSPEDPRVSRSYFREEPIVFENCHDYFDRNAVIRSPSYWFQHTLGEILQLTIALPRCARADACS